MLVLQDPTSEQSTYLLELLVNGFKQAEAISGAFAYVSSSGVRLLTDTPAFKDVADKHRVDLVIGVDAVTNEKALESLIDLSTRYPNITVRAFLNPQPGTIFHPKFCWTRARGSGGRLIIGSGNLTEGGLLGNWEAFAVSEMGPEEEVQVSSLWEQWTTSHAESLVPLHHPEVRSRAQANTLMAQEGDLPVLIAVPAVPEDPEPLVMSNAAQVLIAEIPDNNVRGWKQANFHRDDYFDYFGVQQGTARLFVFRHVEHDGTMGAYEQDRPPVQVRSRNFRFELAAASDVPYPSAGKPIGVFIRMAAFTFFYRLLLPADPGFRPVHDLLETRQGQPVLHYTRGGRERFKMRSTRMTAAELRAAWPDSPFWQALGVP